MKNIAKSFVLVLTVALCVVAAQAQSPVMLRGTVPFNFMVGNHSAPSGDYTVKELDQEIEGWFGPDGHSFIIRTMASDKQGDLGATKLVFHRYGNDYYLTEVWSAGSSHEVRLTSSQQSIAKKQKKFETVAVLMTGSR